jgi:hypothetical protein
MEHLIRERVMIFNGRWKEKYPFMFHNIIQDVQLVGSYTL